MPLALIGTITNNQITARHILTNTTPTHLGPALAIIIDRDGPTTALTTIHNHYNWLTLDPHTTTTEPGDTLIPGYGIQSGDNTYDDTDVITGTWDPTEGITSPDTDDIVWGYLLDGDTLHITVCDEPIDSVPADDLTAAPWEDIEDTGTTVLNHH